MAVSTGTVDMGRASIVLEMADFQAPKECRFFAGRRSIMRLLRMHFPQTVRFGVLS